MVHRQIHIIDDDPSAALVTQRGLQSLLGDSVRVVVSASPNEAWLACARGDVDLLIVDPSPRSTLSTSLVRAVRTYRPDVPILVLTAYDTPGLRARMHALGVDHYVAKPIDLRELAPIVNRAMRLPSRPPGADLIRPIVAPA